MSSHRQGLAAILLLTASVVFADAEVLSRVSHVTAEGIYIDAGRGRGLRNGDVGIVRRDGKEIAQVEVVATARVSARLRLIGTVTQRPVAGDMVHFAPRAPEAKDEPEPDAKKKKKPASEDEFVPLLEEYARRAKLTTKKSIFHGRLSLSQLIQTDNNGENDFFTTLLGTSGSLDRIGGSAWSMRWFGNLSVRGGDAFAESTLDGARFDVFEFTLARRFERGGFLKLGRVLPREVSAAGAIDGAQVEAPVGSTRLGAIVGLKPTRDDLSPSTLR